MNKEYSFGELGQKRVVNVADGQELGHPCDMVFTSKGCVIGICVPGKKNIFKSLTSSESTFIPWNNIIKIGSDVILVELIGGVSVCKTEQNADNE